MAAGAQTRKEVLVKHGLVESVGRRANLGASAELTAVADEVVQIVQVMDGLNRYRFMGDSELLAAWESASNEPVPVRTPKSPDPEGPPAGGEVRPAA